MAKDDFSEALQREWGEEAQSSPVETTDAPARPPAPDAPESPTSGPEAMLRGARLSYEVELRAQRDEALAEITRLKAGREIERTMIRNAVGQLAEKDATIERMAKVGADAIEQLTAERDEAIAEVERLRYHAAKYWRERQALRDEVAILTRVAQGHYGATNAPVCAESCDGQSWTGVDQAEGPDKVWRCDTCGRIVSQSVSNP